MLSNYAHVKGYTLSNKNIFVLRANHFVLGQLSKLNAPQPNPDKSQKCYLGLGINLEWPKEEY